MPTKAEQLGQYLRKQREARGLSMNGLAAVASVDPATVMRLERGEFGRPQVDTLNQLAQALEIDANELYRRAPALKVPEFAPYLRAKLPGLPANRLQEVEEYFRELEARYGSRKGGRRGKRRR